MVDGAPARSGGQKPAAIYEMASKDVLWNERGRLLQC